MVRNSTDTAYFQRLRPYPRILLRRLAARFKDYDKSPIGFGIVVFCIVKDNCRYLTQHLASHATLQSNRQPVLLNCILSSQIEELPVASLEAILPREQMPNLCN